ncbi:hypothetical protein OQA88_2045 [Cercophora sp. LCS_1]
MASLGRLHRLLRLAGPDQPIWVDAISINQSDAQELQDLLGIMGSIYANAQHVGVLLPPRDVIIADILDVLCDMARLLLKFEYTIFGARVHIGSLPAHLGNEFFQQSQPLMEKVRSVQCLAATVDTQDDVFGHDSMTKEERRLGLVCHSFFELLKIFQSKTETAEYWSRAWTFQEWSLARDISLAAESPTDGPIRPILTGVKQLILRAATMLCEYTLSLGQYALWFGFSRGTAPVLFASVRSLFPSEELFTYYGEIDRHLQKRQAAFTSTNGCHSLLRLRPRPYPPESAVVTRQRRLCLMLNSLDVTKRRARYVADLVACWASMCDLQYPYDRDDSLDLATFKAVTALRNAGIRVFNFQCGGGVGLTGVDYWFLRYTVETVQRNRRDSPVVPGAPAWTGRVDTIQHYQMALSLPDHACERYQVSHAPWRYIEGARVERIVPCSNPNHVDAMPFIRSLDGPFQRVEQSVWWSAAETISRYLNSDKFTFVEQAALDGHSLVVVTIPASAAPPRRGVPYDFSSFQAWAICPNYFLKHREKLFVAREGINGTLVLCLIDGTPEGGGKFATLAYLVISDHKCGSFLIATDKTGRIEIRLEEQLRSDISISGSEPTELGPFLTQEPHSDLPWLFARYLGPGKCTSATEMEPNAFHDYLFEAKVSFIGNEFSL